MSYHPPSETAPNDTAALLAVTSIPDKFATPNRETSPAIVSPTTAPPSAVEDSQTQAPKNPFGWQTWAPLLPSVQAHEMLWPGMQKLGLDPPDDEVPVELADEPDVPPPVVDCDDALDVD